MRRKVSGGVIVYGQGNFLFDYSDNEFWQTSMIVCIDEQFDMSYLPLRKTGNAVLLAEGEDRENILQAFWSRSEEIKMDGTIERHYEVFAEEMLETQLWCLTGSSSSILRRVLNKLSGGRYKRWYMESFDSRTLMGIINYIECEAHRELVLAGIRERNKQVR